MKHIINLLLILVFSAGIFAQRAASPCDEAEARAFDWQIGEWRSTDGKQVHEIKRINDGCGVQETWKREGKNSAVGLKTLDDGRHNQTGEKKWFYSWTAPGFHQLWTGRKEEGQWRFYRDWFSEGKAITSRTYWTQISDDKLERIVEQSRDGGKTWTPWVKDAFERVKQTASQPDIDIPAERKFFDFLIGEWKMEKLVAQGETGIGGDDVFKFRKTLDGNGIYSEWYFNRGTKSKPNFIKGEYYSAFDNNSKTWSFYYISPFVSQFYQGVKENGNWWFYKDYDINGDKFTGRQAWEKIDENRLLRIIENSRDGGKTWQRVYAATLKRSAQEAVSPNVRNAHAAVYDESAGRAVLFGGADAEKVLGDTWAYGNEKWLRLSDNSPSQRTFPAMTYDPVHKKVLLFGGNRVLFGKDDNDYGFLSDLWEFDGSTWKKIEASGPGERAEASFIFDRQRRKAVLFGGYRIENGQMKRFSDTWEWDGKMWRKVAEGLPTARSGAAIAYDERRKKVVLFGGGIKSGGAHETWEWDGRSWQEVKTARSEPRYNSVMTYDRARGKIVRFGGWDGKQRVAETWEYDGLKWEKVVVENPPARNHASLYYDTWRQRIVLFGGHDGENIFGDIWEFDGARWTQVISVASQKRVENGH